MYTGLHTYGERLQRGGDVEGKQLAAVCYPPVNWKKHLEAGKLSLWNQTGLRSAPHWRGEAGQFRLLWHSQLLWRTVVTS